MRIWIVSVLIAVSTWTALALGLGNVGLQGALAVGPATLLDQPVVLAIVVLLAAVGGAAVRDSRRSDRLSLLGVLLSVDGLGAVALAPLLVGELRPSDAPLVFIVLTALGLQPLGAMIGVAIRGRLTA